MCVAFVALLVAFFGLTIFLYALAATFFTSYALYFFGGRYPKLGEIQWPNPPPPPLPPRYSDAVT
jgi:hypothetical protein